ncbi:MAG TPA: LysM peptidoglycan-binding domain-containing protein [Acidimicrobiales bacterium]|nr:LysM peptidoglycan-binding domain-containing protein [Acidimicrobiales bacterium]
MAIAPLPEIAVDDPECDIPWPRPALRLVTPTAAEPVTGFAAAVPVSTGRDVTERRRARASVRIRRRRVVAGLLVAGALTLLALPVTGLGGRPAGVHPSTAPAGGFTYVVQPGDTLWSIATQVDRSGSPRTLVQELASETGSENVYPGERIVVP